MTMKEAMGLYFDKLRARYMKECGTAPTAMWENNAPHSLFIGGPNEEEEAPWSPKEAQPLDASVARRLCPELQAFYGSWYFLFMRGRLTNLSVYFGEQSSASKAAAEAVYGLEEGEAYFPGKSCVLLGSCEVGPIDEMLLFYNQQSGTLFVYDMDREECHPVKTSLTELIAKMEALL